MRWNTGLLQYEPDLEHPQAGPPEHDTRAFWILLGILAVVLVALLLALRYA